MKKLSTILFTFAFALPAVANVDPKIAEFCLKAQDFQGCVKSMSGDSSGTTTTIRQIQQKGADLAEGNQCPAGFAYIGGGNCQEVKCRGGTGMGNDYRLAGKGWSCKKVLGMFGGELVLEGDIVRATLNPSCDNREPEIGRESSCHNPRRLRPGIDIGESSSPVDSESSFVSKFYWLREYDECKNVDFANGWMNLAVNRDCAQRYEGQSSRYE